MHEDEDSGVTNASEASDAAASQPRQRDPSYHLMRSPAASGHAGEHAPESLFRDLLEAAPDAMVIVGDDGTIQLVNEQLERLFGYARDELLGKPVEMLIPQRFREHHPKHRANYVSDPHPRPMGAGLSLRAVRRDGSEFPAEISLAPMRSARGVLVTAAIRDVTQRVRTEDALREAKHAAEAAARAKTTFLANMSHEIRTPLTAVLGFADLLLDPRLGPGDRLGHALTIRRNGEHLLALLNDILDISKIEAGKLEIETIACSPARVLSEVASLMRVRAVEKGLAFEVEYAPDLPAEVRTDPTRLRQIVLNLVSNAIKFTEQGRVKLTASCGPSDENRRTELVVAVQDTGIGISDEQRRRLFQPFAQADASMTRRYGGTGLGLGICAPLASALGGDIEVASELGRGSTFTLRVPVAVAAGTRRISDAREALIAPEGSPAASDAVEPPRGGRVLLAEDGRDNQVLIAHLLRTSGFEVTVVENGRRAVQHVLRAQEVGQPYHLVLMDMQMPELDGYGATAELRANDYRGSIVALTAHAMAGERERCLAAGCDDYLTKPIDRPALIAAVTSYVRDARRTWSLRAPAHGEQRAASHRPEPAADVTAQLVSTFADDPDMADLVSSFVTGLPAQLAAIAAATRDCNHELVTRLAHQLKGAAGGYGFPSITEAAATLEHTARGRADLEALEHALERLRQLVRRTQPELSVDGHDEELPPRLLAIDDSPHIQDVIAARLRVEGVQLQRALDAAEGLRLAREWAPDLVLLDIELPDMSGLDVCRQLKGDPKTAAIPVVFLTGTADAKIKASALDLGAIDYVTKPFDGIELRARVRSALRTKRYHDLLAKRAQVDGLTGLWNRAHFDVRLNEEAASRMRHRRPLTVVMLDVDHFKRINDSYGHPFGDQVLCAIASALRKTLRTNDIVCRYGGEEFALILRDTPLSTAPLVAERIRTAIAELAFAQRGQTVRVTASLGVAATADERAPSGAIAATLVSAADAALYSAKRDGRNCVVTVPVDV